MVSDINQGMCRATGTITSLLTDRSHCAVRFKDRLDELSEFFVARDMPKELVSKVKGFYMLKVSSAGAAMLLHRPSSSELLYATSQVPDDASLRRGASSER